MSFTPSFLPQLPPSDDHWVLGISGNRILVHRQNDSFLANYRQYVEAGLTGELLHLGDWSKQPCFALLLDPNLDLTTSDTFISTGLRSQLGAVSDELFLLAGRALQLAHWQEFHRYCGRCGVRTQAQLHERVLACCSCGALYYPRIAPCVIGIVERGNECLLAHNTRFSEGLYSVLAGFIEPGETAEQALIREIREETGIEVDNPVYVCSQPWPFPSQLMLGFSTRYHSGDIAVDGVEISHAAWFTIDKLPQIPPANTISGKLIHNFIQRVKSQD